MRLIGMDWVADGLPASHAAPTHLVPEAPIQINRVAPDTVLVDFGRVAGQGLVDRVINDFVDKVMEPGRSRGADVHGWTLTHRFKAFENLDLVGSVVVRRLRLLAV